MTTGAALTAAIAVIAAVLGVAAVISTRRRRVLEREAAVPGESRGRVQMMDPRGILFSLPTIHDGLPRAEPRRSDAADTFAAIIREDDWRQQELVAAANAEYVDRTLSEIRSHRAVHAVGIGFREIHVRGEPPVPLAEAGIAVDELMLVMGVSQRGAIWFNNGQLDRAVGGFSLEIPDGGFVYGHAEKAGRVTALGIGLVGDPLGTVPEPVARLTAHFGLLFVDWVREVVVPPGDAAGLRAWVDRVLAEQPDDDA